MKFSSLTLSMFAICLSTVSCKKQYSCQCSTTIETPGYYPYTQSVVTPIDKKTTKKRAEVICAQTEKQLNKNTDDYTSPDEKLTTSCAVK